MTSQRRSVAVIVGDLVGLMHLLVANIIVALGETTSIFSSFGGEYPGITFLYEYVDWPIVYALSSFSLGNAYEDPIHHFLLAELIIIIASFFYGVASYLFVKIISFLLSA